MPDERRSKVHRHPDASKAPEPSASCPRCHYWEQRAAAQVDTGRMQNASGFPDGINQSTALRILVRAFPKSYGVKQ